MTSNSSSSAAVRFVIVGFDGLRPDSVEADMPALSRFMASNHSWSLPSICTSSPRQARRFRGRCRRA